MQRRKFVKDSGMVAIGMAVLGNISWKDDHFIGDTPTTTDVLGPFYRPNAPFRKNLNPPSFEGHVLHLKGTLFTSDASKPMKDALIEIWQCKQDGSYDNTSEDYLYRASQKIGKDGKYFFTTAVPIPYPEENENRFRPAHIHLRISVPGQQDLITQIYLQNDPYLNIDPSTKSPLAIKRILPLKKLKENESEIQFDIVLQKEYLPDNAVFKKLSGIYKMNDGALMEFYRDADFLFWKRNGQIRGGLAYIGENSFIGGNNEIKVKFELLQDGGTKIIFQNSRRKGGDAEGEKILSYEK